MSALMLGRSHTNAKNGDEGFLKELIRKTTCKFISGRNYKNANSVEQDCPGVVLSNYTHSYWSETIPMLGVWSRVFTKQ